ncbi:MAG: hypothetical protein J5602_06405, partial [Clostridia bacterium]|nr:hypothetical protein [Clostridia bacterium]
VNMTSKERLAAYIAGEKVDRRPNLTIVGSAVCRYADGGAGMTVETYCKDYSKMAEAAAVAARDMKLDFIQIASDLLREAEGYGTTINWFADKLPSAKKYALDDISEVEGLHTLKTREIPRLYDLVEAAKSALSDPDVDPMVLAVGPMTVAGNIRGVQDFLVDMFDEPELCGQLLEIVTGTTLDFIDCLAEAGVKYAYVADPVASLVSPTVYEEMLWPLHKKIFARMAERGIAGRLHMCGNTTGILPYSSVCGAKIVDVDHMVDFSKALDIAGGNCILNGNIDPVADVYTCEASHTKEAILAVAEKAAGRRAMFMPGCELPTDTATANILAIHEALKEIGG